jgi:ParB-like chromosome segregation protein Spo0J
MTTIVTERIEALIPWSANARTHSPKQVRQIAGSIKSFGFTNPVLIDDQRRILAGHGRVAAARQLGSLKFLAFGSITCRRIRSGRT